MISKFIVFTLLVILTILTALVLVWSFGWHFPMFIVILIPVIIMHGLACKKAYTYNPRFNGWILLSAVAFLAFTLFRSDVDAQGEYSGYSSLLYHFGSLDTMYIVSWKYSLEVTLLFLLAQIFLNTYILRTKVNKNDQYT